MVQLVADANLHEKLESVRDRAEVRDAGGRLLGFFTPVSPEEAEMYRRAAAKIDPEEIRRRKEMNAPGRPFREVIESIMGKTES